MFPTKRFDIFLLDGVDAREVGIFVQICLYFIFGEETHRFLYVLVFAQKYLPLHLEKK